MIHEIEGFTKTAYTYNKRFRIEEKYNGDPNWKSK